MEDLLSDIEITVIEKELHRKSFDDIAFLIDRPVNLVGQYVADWLKENIDIVPYQHVIDQKKASRQPVARKPREKKEKKKEPVVYSRVITPEKLQSPNTRRLERHYKTRKQDYSQKVLIKIDDKTHVYANPDQDPEEVRKKWRKVMQDNDARKPIQKWDSKKSKDEFNG